MIDYLSQIRCPIIGTHKRVLNYPFRFGYQAYMGNRVRIEENGAKMVYWATKHDNKSGKRFKALAYRSGKGNVATVFSTSPEVDTGHFTYVPKKDAAIPKLSKEIRDHIANHVTELTYGQGGSEWHIIRAGMGYVTSSVVSLILNFCLNIN